MRKVTEMVDLDDNDSIGDDKDRRMTKKMVMTMTIVMTALANCNNKKLSCPADGE